MKKIGYSYNITTESTHDIVFSTKFMNAFKRYYYGTDRYIEEFYSGTNKEWENLGVGSKWEIMTNQFNNLTDNHLDDPIDYLYYLIMLND